MNWGIPAYAGMAVLGSNKSHHDLHAVPRLYIISLQSIESTIIAFSIKNERAEELVRTLAQREGISITGTIKLAVTNELQRKEAVSPDTRRDAILDRLADYVLAQGLSASSLRPLAKAAQTSDRMLLYYFSDKAEIIAATLDRISLRLVGVMNEQTAQTPLPLDQLRPKLLAIVLADAMWPYMRLWLEIASLAARGDVFYRSVGEQIARGFLAWGAAQLDSASETDAANLLIMIEGTVLLKSVGLDDVCRQAL